MQLAIKEMSTYETEISNNPPKLLPTVESLMCTPERAKYPWLMLVEVLSSFLKLKQGDNEELLDYLERFKSEMEVVTKLFGSKFLDGYTEARVDYVAETNTNKKKR